MTDPVGSLQGVAVPEAWESSGACVDYPDLPSDAWVTPVQRIRDKAKQVCLNECPVFAECREWASVNRARVMYQVRAGRWHAGAGSTWVGELRDCERCGREFNADNYVQIYCTQTCYRLASANRKQGKRETS